MLGSRGGCCLAGRAEPSRAELVRVCHLIKRASLSFTDLLGCQVGILFLLWSRDPRLCCGHSGMEVWKAVFFPPVEMKKIFSAERQSSRSVTRDAGLCN